MLGSGVGIMGFLMPGGIIVWEECLWDSDFLVLVKKKNVENLRVVKSQAKRLHGLFPPCADLALVQGRVIPRVSCT